MPAITEIPLLAHLPKQELARLVSDLEELQVPAGATFPGDQELNQWLYFVMQGELEVVQSGVAGEMTLITLGPGDVFGEASLFSADEQPTRFRALSAVRVCRLPGAKIGSLLRTEPKLVDQLVKVFARKLSAAYAELGRTKAILSAYTDAVWADIPLPPAREAVAALHDAESTAPASPARAGRSSPQTTQWRPRVIAGYVGVAASVVASWLLFRHFAATPQFAVVSAVLLWATCNWLLDVIPDHVVGLAAGILLVALGAVTPAVAFSGFANSSWFLLVGAGGLGVAVTRSGLLYRIALHMLRLLPSTYTGQSLALMLTGVIFTPLLPSVNSRMAMASPLARELSEAMRFPPRGRGAAGLAMATFLGFGLVYFIFLNGANTSLLAWSLLPESARAHTTWTGWLLSALPMGVGIFLGCYAGIRYLFPPEPTTGVSRQTVSSQLQVLGPMSRMERITGWVLAAVLIGFITQQLHGLDPAWIALGGFLVLTATGVVDKAAIAKIDWRFLLLFGSLVSMSEVIKVSGVSTQLSHLVQPLLAPLGWSPYLFLPGVALLTLLFRLLIPLQTTVLVMIVALLPVSAQFGYNPTIIALIVLALSNTWIIPQQNSMYVTVHSGTEEAFTHAQARPLAYIHAVVGLLAVAASVPLWSLLGMVPR